MNTPAQLSLILTLIVSFAIEGPARSAPVLEHWYEMGETGALPSDSVAAADFTSVNGSAATVVAGSSGAPGSTSYLFYDAGSFSSGASLGSVQDDNFAVGGWFRVDTILGSRNDIALFRGGSFLSGAPDLLLSDGGAGDADGWAASLSGTAWVGQDQGVEDSAAAGVWAHLAIVRDNGTATLYINGIAQASTTNAAAAWGNGATLGSNNGATGQGLGVDDLRIYTFDPGEGADALAAFFTTVPEPSSLALLGLGGLLVARRRRD